MTFQFRPARREQAPLLIGVAGPSGSGKTASALKLARGIVGGDEGIYLVDTEAVEQSTMHARRARNPRRSVSISRTAISRRRSRLIAIWRPSPRR